MHVLLEVAGAIIGVVPLAAIALAYRGTPSARLALAFVAFLVLEARLIALVLVHTVFVVDHVFQEAMEFGGDLLVIVMFAAAFLSGTGWSRGRSRPSLP